MTEPRLIFGTDKDLGAAKHLLNHNAGGSVYLHHAVVFCRQHSVGADVQCHSANVALVDRTDHLQHHRKSAFIGKCHDGVFV